MNLIEFLNDLLMNWAEDLAVRMGDSDFDDILRGKNIRSGTGAATAATARARRRKCLRESEFMVLNPF